MLKGKKEVVEYEKGKGGVGDGGGRVLEEGEEGKLVKVMKEEMEMLTDEKGEEKMLKKKIDEIKRWGAGRKEKKER